MSKSFEVAKLESKASKYRATLEKRHAKAQKAEVKTQKKQDKLDRQIDRAPRVDVMGWSWILKGICGIFFKPTVIGELPKSGGMVAIVNHQNDLDSFVIFKLALKSKRRVRFFSKVELFRYPVIGWVMRAGRHIPVLRNTSRAKEALAIAIRQAKAGECIVVFPEGTITQDPQWWPMTGKPGAAITALEAGVPIIPVMIDGTGNQRPPGWGGVFHIRWNRLRCPVVVKVLDPVDTHDLGQNPSRLKEDAKIATERALDAITLAMAEHRQIKSPEKRWDTRVDGQTWFW